MQHHHRVLFGDEVLTGLKIPISMHRAQLEYELREKIILLRQRLLETGDNDRALWELLLGSVSTFATLFRHALLALGDVAPHSKREAIQILATRNRFRAVGFSAIAGHPRPQGGTQAVRRQRSFHPLSGCRAARNRRSRYNAGYDNIDKK